MSRSITQNANPFGAVLYENTALGATPDDNIRGGATTVYQVCVDNTANSAATYLNAWNNANPTVGSTPPDFSFLIPATSKKTITLDFTGILFGTALSLACTTTAGGSTAPNSNTIVYGLMT
jgi:hypothetical protein